MNIHKIMLLVLSLFLLPGCGPVKVGPAAQKIVILGFDGLDYDYVKKWMGQGRLPNMRRLAEQGSFNELRTTNPAESPVAWASFITGTNPGKTGIYDFLKRDLETYYPKFAVNSSTEAKFVLGKWIPVKRPKAILNRKGEAFWDIAARAGVPVRALRMPVCFPAKAENGVKLLCGLGVPDIRGTMGTFSYYATDVWADEDTEMGGKVVGIEFFDGAAETVAFGPLESTLPIYFKRLPEQDALIISVGEREVRLTSGSWSEMVEFEFKVAPLVKVKGIGRFHLMALAPETRLYLSPISFDPRDPPFDISYPRKWSRQLAQENGLFKTLGWGIDTWAYNEGRISSEIFLDDVYYTMNRRADIVMKELEKREWQMMLSVFEASDRVQHMFYRYLDPRHPLYNDAEARKNRNAILEVYQRADEIVGSVMGALDGNTMLLVMSDHGFNSFRRAVNLNTYLAMQGYLQLKSATGANDRTLHDLFGQGEFWPNVDWPGSKAYALGLGQIYVNLKGREKYGLVEPGEEYERLLDELRISLLRLRDPQSGERVILSVTRGSEIYHGPCTDGMPDLVVGFAPGYRVSWQTCLGGMPKGVVVDNDRRWSGDHCSVDPEHTKGTLLCNRALFIEDAGIMDLAPTVLKYLGLEVPANMDGKPLL